MTKDVVVRVLLAVAVVTTLGAIVSSKFLSNIQFGLVAFLAFFDPMSATRIVLLAIAGITSFATLIVASTKPQQPRIKTAAVFLSLFHGAIWGGSLLVLIAMGGFAH